MQNQQKLIKIIYPWIIWLLGAGFFFYKYLIQVSPSVMTEDLMKAFNVNGAWLGNLTAFYFYAYLIMQIPVGILLDKYSPRLLTGVAIFFCSISTYVFSQTDSLLVAITARALMGAGAAFAGLSCLKLVTLWFSPKRFALISGLCMTAAMLGGIGGQMPLSFLVQNVGWREALQIISIIGIILGSIYLIVVRDKTKPPSTKPQIPTSLGQNLISVLTNKQTWLLSFYSGLAFAPLSVFGGLWGVPYLETVYSLSRNNAAFAISFIFIGFAVGAPFLGWLSDFMQRRKPILFVGTLLALVSILSVLFFSNNNLIILSTLLFIFGFGTSGFFASFAMLRELFPIMLSATVIGIMNTFDSACEALYEPVIGAFLDFTWDGKIINGIPKFSTSDYYMALIILPLSLMSSIIILFFIKETYCVPYENLEKHKHQDKIKMDK